MYFKTSFEFILSNLALKVVTKAHQPSAQSQSFLQTFYPQALLWVFTCIQKTFFYGTSESCCGRQREPLEIVMEGFALPLHSYNNKARISLLLYISISILHSRWIASSSLNIYLCLRSLFNSI